eukprot:scaffold20621_cov156-Amphora_coffeaeformis.AAC.2
MFYKSRLRPVARLESVLLRRVLRPLAKPCFPIQTWRRDADPRLDRTVYQIWYDSSDSISTHPVVDFWHVHYRRH